MSLWRLCFICHLIALRGHLCRSSSSWTPSWRDSLRPSLGIFRALRRCRPPCRPAVERRWAQARSLMCKQVIGKFIIRFCKWTKELIKEKKIWHRFVFLFLLKNIYIYIHIFSCKIMSSRNTSSWRMLEEWRWGRAKWTFRAVAGDHRGALCRAPRQRVTLLEYNTSYHLILYHAVLYHVILYYVMLHHVISYHITLYSIFYFILFYSIVLYYVKIVLDYMPRWRQEALSAQGADTAQSLNELRIAPGSRRLWMSMNVWGHAKGRWDGATCLSVCSLILHSILYCILHYITLYYIVYIICYDLYMLHCYHIKTSVRLQHVLSLGRLWPHLEPGAGQVSPANRLGRQDRAFGCCAGWS